MKVDFPNLKDPSPTTSPLLVEADATQNMELVTIPLMDFFGRLWVEALRKLS